MSNNLDEKNGTIDHILNKWREDAAESDYSKERLKGTAFEELCIVYLTHDRLRQTEYKNVVSYSRWAEEQGLPVADDGIDLVAEMHDQEGYCAIQCKFYKEGTTLSKALVNDFLSASSKRFFTRRLFIDTTTNWNSTIDRLVQDQSPEFVRLSIQSLRSSPIDWTKYVTNGEVVKEKAKSPRPYQEEAIAKVVDGLDKPGTRGQLIMACGTGKTFTALRIAENLVKRGGQVLYLVPSLALMQQSVRQWGTDRSIKMRFYAVCSDAQVGRPKKRQDDKIEMHSHDLEIPATTDSRKLAKAVGKPSHEKLTVVFATYQSLPKIKQAQQEYGLPDFDLAICDEAHRTAGSRKKGKPDQDSHFIQIHEQEHIRATRRLYMTATPRVYAETARNQAGEMNTELYSMGNENVFGPVLFTITFSDAIQGNWLSDYKVVILTVPEDELLRDLPIETWEDHDIDLDMATKIVGCCRAIAKAESDEFIDDPEAMKTAIAYCRSIKESEGLRGAISEVSENYQSKQIEDPNRTWSEKIDIRAEHVDGTHRAQQRDEKLVWLENPSDQECRIITNCRCLSEGVDVPTLDAIMFMQPRKSHIEVVQAVGRVMRPAPDGKKERGYVILPVAIPEGKDPYAELDNNETYRIVWQVINAIRSHDEDLTAQINLIESGQKPSRISIIQPASWSKKTKKRNAGRSDGGNGEKEEPDTDPEILEPEIPFEYDKLHQALLTKILDKCGSLRYWSEWAGDVEEIARKHIVRITNLVNRHEAARKVFARFLKEVQDDLNEGISKEDAIEMLAQHMITKPVFEALLGDSPFAMENPVSQGMDDMLYVLSERNIEKEAESLQGFYESVRRRAEQAITPGAQQKLIKELYDKFFQKAFKRTSERLGIVYTPIEIVDFILHSVDDLLRSEFNETLSAPGVQILDPFTGTGAFIVRMIENGLITPDALPHKYLHEIHANEIVLLAYYIAAVNIEAAYHAAVGANEYERFPGIVLTDTFEMQDSEDMFADLLVDNSEQRKRQKKAQIKVIVGNPPWSMGQRNENDNAKNQAYPHLHRRIDGSYAKYSNAKLKTSLKDSYVLSIRWASDRIGESGVIGFVTNAGWLDGLAMDGMRRCLAEDFTSIYVLNLRGNQRTQGEKSRQEGGKVFGAGSRAAVAITLFVKNPERTGCEIQYYDIGDYLSREDKLKRVDDLKSLNSLGGELVEVHPDKHHDWLNQRDPAFDGFMVLGDKSKHPGNRVFKKYSQGVKTNRDAWVYNYSEDVLRKNVQRMIEFYNSERKRLAKANSKGPKWTEMEINDFVRNDSTKISWSGDLKERLRRMTDIAPSHGRVVKSQYRPFTRQYLFFSSILNNSVYAVPHLFPHAGAENRVICVPGKGEKNPFSCILVREIPNHHLISGGQCFPMWLYFKPRKSDPSLFTDDRNLETDSHGYVRETALSPDAMGAFSEHVGESVSGEDLFCYIYAVLHVPSYRNKFEANLRKELPRIPFPKDADEFYLLSEVGQELGDLHVDYEDVEEFPMTFKKGGWKPREEKSPEDWFRVHKMKHPKKEKKNVLSEINYNDNITIENIPMDAYDYLVNGKSAIGWVMDRQQVSTNKDSKIVNDANRFAIETIGDPAYPLRLLARVITVSLETNKLVDRLRDIEFS